MSQPIVNTAKNRQRDPYSFANINLLGHCNVHCFFCLGLDIEQELKDQDQLRWHFQHWARFDDFLDRCREHDIVKLYLTGQNTDAALYPHLSELIDYVHERGFQLGLRTNGYAATPQFIELANRCELSTGYSIHSLSPITTKMILGRANVPDWDRILSETQRARVSIVLNRCNEHEFWDVLRFVAQYQPRYVQVRRVSTDTRLELLAPDMAAYERVYSEVSRIFGPPARKFVADAEEYHIYDVPVVFWRTVKTSVNSLNYFTDGTISDEYFIVEGYLKHRSRSAAV
jgi:molybdenum cofactor biosynthesis enzyme MoaA